MRPDRPQRLPLVVATGAVAAALVLISGSASPVGAQSAQARGGCPNQATESRRLSQGEARRALKCLINKERGGKRQLRLHRRLNGPAKRHSRAMKRNNCLSHTCPGEPASIGRRLRRYLRGASKTRFGEAIAVNRASATPGEIVAQWMASPPHRKILLGRFKHLGVGVATGDGRTWYTAIFGFRSG